MFNYLKNGKVWHIIKTIDGVSNQFVAYCGFKASAANLTRKPFSSEICKVCKTREQKELKQ